MDLFLWCILQEFYTEDPKTFKDYGRIVNQRHFRRVVALMEGSTVALGGDRDESQCYIGTVSSHVSKSAACPIWTDFDSRGHCCLTNVICIHSTLFFSLLQHGVLMVEIFPSATSITNIQIQQHGPPLFNYAQYMKNKYIVNLSGIRCYCDWYFYYITHTHRQSKQIYGKII